MGEGPPAFDVCGPLPSAGIAVLEASAGTGKTFTIAALATRLVADGVPLSRILAVTFTRMATGELRERVRARLVSAEEGLGHYLDSGLVPCADDRVLSVPVLLRRQPGLALRCRTDARCITGHVIPRTYILRQPRPLIARPPHTAPDTSPTQPRQRPYSRQNVVLRSLVG